MPYIRRVILSDRIELNRIESIRIGSNCIKSNQIELNQIKSNRIKSNRIECDLFGTRNKSNRTLRIHRSYVRHYIDQRWKLSSHWITIESSNANAG